MRKKGRPKKQKSAKVIKVPGKRGRPRRKEIIENEPPFKKAKRGRPRSIKVEQDSSDVIEDPLNLIASHADSRILTSNDAVSPEENYSEGLHMSTMQVRALSSLVACLECGEEVVLGVRPTTKGMISEFTVTCKVCDSQKSTNTPNLIRERKRKREKKGVILQKNENINYAHVAAYLDNGLGYSGLRHYCKYLNARCLNEATFIVYAKQVISDVVSETEEFLQQNARIVRKAFESQLHSDYIIDLTVGYTTTYHQWGSDFCLVAGAVIELQTGLVLDYDVGNMYCHVCKINAKKIVSMSPAEMTEWFNKHQDTCEIREWCDEIDQDSEEGIKEIDPKYLEAFIAKKIWSRSLEKFGFRYTTLIHESDERIHSELLKGAPYGDIPVIIDNITNCFSRRKSEHARTSFQNKLKAKCPRERVQTKDRIMYVYAMSIPEYNKFAIGSNIKLRELVRRMEIEEEEYATELSLQASDTLPSIQEQELIDERSGEKVGDAFEVEKELEEQIQDDDEEEDAQDEDENEMQDDELMDSQDVEVLEEEEEEFEESTTVSNIQSCRIDVVNEKNVANDLIINKFSKEVKSSVKSKSIQDLRNISPDLVSSSENCVEIKIKLSETNEKVLKSGYNNENFNDKCKAPVHKVILVEGKSMPGASSEKKLTPTANKKTVSSCQLEKIHKSTIKEVKSFITKDVEQSSVEDNVQASKPENRRVKTDSNKGNEGIKKLSKLETVDRVNDSEEKKKAVRTENGSEQDIDSQSKQTEIIKPFRVDFDED